MSATATVTIQAPTMTTTTNIPTATCCPRCGSDLELPPFEETQVALLQAHRKIGDLQAQVRLLNQKASAAIDRWADYEDELAKLRSALDASQRQQQQKQPVPRQQSTPETSPSRSSFLSASAASRISALLSPRKSAPTNFYSNPSPDPTVPVPVPLPLPATDNDLHAALSREHTLRLAAETRLSATSREVEELSAQLFEQANEMVASERRARAALEERVETLERREEDKRRRLERLESAVGRIERAREVLRIVGGMGVVADGET